MRLPETTQVMWCTRWYIPLAFLAVPTASPFFLLLFLFSTTLQARPCFYCIVLLSLSFMSSCFWSPLPLDSTLSEPWSENITTFADVLYSVMPDLTEQEKPEMIQLIDRCWCDLSNSAFFEPFNITQWELNSILRLKEELEEKRAAAAIVALDAGAGGVIGASTNEGGLLSAGSDGASAGGSRRAWTELWDRLRLFSQKAGFHSNTWETSTVPSPRTTTAAIQPDTPSPPELAASLAPSQSSAPFNPPEKLPTFRGEYDLRPYGFALVLDFNWSAPR